MLIVIFARNTSHFSTHKRVDFCSQRKLKNKAINIWASCRQWFLYILIKRGWPFVTKLGNLRLLENLLLSPIYHQLILLPRNCHIYVSTNQLIARNCTMQRSYLQLVNYSVLFLICATYMNITSTGNNNYSSASISYDFATTN